jgi:hypothetical protein
MAATPEELALELSRATLASQEQIETQLREKSTTVLSAASIVVPVAAVAVGGGPELAAIPFCGAAAAYFFCARACGAALFPQDIHAGLLGSEMLEMAKTSEADLRQMHAAAASYLDAGYRHNQAILKSSAASVRSAIILLTVEILVLVVALVVILAD